MISQRKIALKKLKQQYPQQKIFPAIEQFTVWEDWKIMETISQENVYAIMSEVTK